MILDLFLSGLIVLFSVIDRLMEWGEWFRGRITRGV